MTIAYRHIALVGLGLIASSISLAARRAGWSQGGDRRRVALPGGGQRVSLRAGLTGAGRHRHPVGGEVRAGAELPLLVRLDVESGRQLGNHPPVMMLMSGLYRCLSVE